MSRIDAVPDALSAAERTEEVRRALVGAAAAAERRNRPVYLVIVACVLLAACLVSLAWSLLALRAARGEFGRERAVAASLAQAVGRLKELEASQGAGADKGQPANEPILTKLQGAAERAGMVNADKLIPRQGAPESRGGGVQRVKFEYDAVRDPSLEALLLWLKYVGEDLPGVEVFSVTLRPESGGWVMKVVFQRWQRANP